VFVKVCGITNAKDADWAARCGASAIGFVFCSSPRQVAPEEVRVIREELSPHVLAVGVFTEEPVARIREVAAYCGLDLVQLHGDPSPDICRHVGLPCIRAIRVRDERSLRSIHDYREAVHAVLLDAWDAERAGGTGRVFDWRLASRVRCLGMPVILAGGLTPGNVGAAVSAVRPHGVDVSSGVEARPGVKDPALVRRFVMQARLRDEREVIRV
jgi:phosphoribosylanthranilate isomerase